MAKHSSAAQKSGSNTSVNTAPGPTIPVGIFRTDAAGKVLYVSEGWCQITGVELDQVLGDGWSDNIHPDDRDRAITIWQEVVDSAIPNADEFRVVHPNGDIRWVRVERAPELDDKGAVTGFIGTRTDITERKAADTLLVKSEAALRRYEQLADASPDLMAFIDRDYRYLAVNNAYLDAYKMPREKIIGRTISELNGEDRYLLYKPKHESCLAGQGLRVQQELNYAGWGICHMDIAFQPIRDRTDKVIGVSIVARDITDRHLAELKLKQAHAERTHILKNANISISHVKDREIVDADHASQVLWGWSPEDYLGKDTSFMYANREEYERIGRESAPVLRTGNSYETEVDLRHKDGYTFPVRSVGVAIDPEDISKGSLWLTEDISDQKKNEEELKAARDKLELRVEERTRELRAAVEQAETANKAKSKFLSSMSHELRTPMNAVLGFAQLLENDSTGDLSDSQMSFVSEVLRSGNHMMELIDGVLDLAKIEDGKFAPNMEDLEVNELVSQCVTMIETAARQQNVRVQNNVSATNLPKVSTDRLSFRQTLLNLLSNAVKYNQEGGFVIINAEVRGGIGLRLSVQDSGSGIPEDVADKVFEPFERLGAETSAIPGTGVGLAVTKQLIENMGGSIGFDPVPEGGTTFWFEVPLAASATLPQD